MKRWTLTGVDMAAPGEVSASVSCIATFDRESRCWVVDSEGDGVVHTAGRHAVRTVGQTADHQVDVVLAHFQTRLGRVP